ncbi:MAG: hypothetical protein ICV51_12580 [Flavisolibacter sp.]|nr:hypothetical protein [Flavisolibacter sp.]MBD0376454.1 hypothetical protein [Flavisolibacter sp.]
MRITVFKDEQTTIEYDPQRSKWYAVEDQKKIEYDLGKEENLSSILKILYIDPNIFLEKLKKVQNESSLSEEFIDSFPIAALILFCIKNDLIFWLEQALKWLKHIRVSNELFVELVAVINNRKYPQKLRHQLKKQITQV